MWRYVGNVLIFKVTFSDGFEWAELFGRFYYWICQVFNLFIVGRQEKLSIAAVLERISGLEPVAR